LAGATTGCYSSIVAANIYDSVKQALQDLIAPQLESIKGEIGELRGEMRGEIGTIRGEIGALRAEMRGDIGAIHGDIGTLRGEVAEVRAEMRGNHAALSSEIRRIDDKLTWALDLRERIVALETKLGS
jgi:hypothetical protein